MGDRARATVQKSGGLSLLCPFPWGHGYPYNTTSLGPRLTSIPSGIMIHSAVWPQYTRADKWGLRCPFRRGIGGSPSNTMSPGPRSTSVPSGILINPAVWPQ